MEDYKRLEPLWSTLSDGDFLRVLQTLFLRSVPAFSVRPVQISYGALRGFCGPLHSSFQHVAGTSSWHRSRVRTFDCRIHGS